MKKIIILIIALICSGCGKKLTCTYKENYEDIKINNKIVFNFKDNTYKEEDIMVFIDSDKAEEYFNDILDYVDMYNLELMDNKIVSKLNGDISESKKEIKKKYESYDFKCK